MSGAEELLAGKQAMLEAAIAKHRDSKPLHLRIRDLQNKLNRKAATLEQKTKHVEAAQSEWDKTKETLEQAVDTANVAEE